MLRRTFLLATLLSLGCSSSDFDVADTTDSATSDTGINTGGTDGAAIAPCDPEPDKAKYCIEVKLAGSAHPPYTAGSGALGLNIDGVGKAFVAMWDVDPTKTPAGMPSPEPKVVIPYPKGDADQIAVDKDLPVTLSGADTPGEYTVMGAFADNDKVVRAKGEMLPGDFVVVPTVSAGKLVYPKITLEMGKVAKTTLLLLPNRKVAVTVGFDAAFVTYAQTKKTIHGDGPVMFSMFNGALSSTSFLSLDVHPCIATTIQTSPMAHVLDFTTTIEGTHNVFVALFDYAAEPSFPGKGSLTSAPIAPYPSITIDGTSWIANTTVELKSVHLGEYSETTAPPDMLKCDP